jgi:hypothetical protein
MYGFLLDPSDPSDPSSRRDRDRLNGIGSISPCQPMSQSPYSVNPCTTWVQRFTRRAGLGCGLLSVSESRCQKNPIFSKNRIFKSESVSKKNPIFSKNRIFKSESVSKKSDFFTSVKPSNQKCQVNQSGVIECAIFGGGAWGVESTEVLEGFYRGGDH